MKIKIIQLVVEKDILSNKEKILDALETAEKEEWIIFPEAMLSGYYPNEDLYTAGLDWAYIADSLREVQAVIAKNECHCILGSATKWEGNWHNSVLVFSYTGHQAKHDKIRLSSLDKKHFQAGKQLQFFELQGIKYGLQACRELIFPTPWSRLKKEGAQIIFHLNNAIQPHDALWKHMLITRAIENSVYVISVNNAAFPQQLASYIISPAGIILAETKPQVEQEITLEIDLKQVISNLSERSDY